MAKVTSDSIVTHEWVSKNGKWTINVWDNNVNLIMVTDGYLSDWPIVYDDGRIAYDSEYFVPKYVRAMVEKIVKVVKR